MTLTKDNIKGQNVSVLERWISSIAGGVLLAQVLTKKKGRFVFPALLAIGGAELLRRGISGYCMLYNAFGINMSLRKPPMASVKHGEGIKHEKTLTINRPV